VSAKGKELILKFSDNYNKDCLFENLNNDFKFKIQNKDIIIGKKEF
jgi:hypothetical protein